MEDNPPTKSEALQLAMLLMIAQQLDILLQKRPLTTEIRDFVLKHDQTYDALLQQVSAIVQQYSASTRASDAPVVP